MREIKFRAWDSHEMRMVKPDRIINLSGLTSECLKIDSPKWILEQYTGLKDKNGKDIYDGDIIEHKFSHKINIKTYEEITSIGFKRCVVSFENGCFGYKIIKQENSYYGEMPSRFFHLYYIETWNHFEVIGNIHENPELLK